MIIKPLGDRVLVEPAQAEEVTAGGIIIPDSAKEKPLKGKVIAVGNGTKDEEMIVKAGDVVLLLNDVNGVPMLDGNTSGGNGNSVINSIELVSRLFVLLNLNTDYHIVNIKEIEKTADHVAYQVYVNNNNNNQN